MKLHTILIMVVVLIALGAVFFVFGRSKPIPPKEPRQFVWQVEMNDLKIMAISLPREGKREAWIKHEDKYWYFDELNGPRVNMKRWGGGIPLLLSGPGAKRLIAKNATKVQLRIYGLDNPQMHIELMLENKDIIAVNVGDKSPDGQATISSWQPRKMSTPSIMLGTT